MRAIMADPDPAGGSETTIPMPGWVKAFGAIAIVLILAFLVLHLTGFRPTGHGP